MFIRPIFMILSIVTSFSLGVQFSKQDLEKMKTLSEKFFESLRNQNMTMFGYSSIKNSTTVPSMEDEKKKKL